MTTSQLAHALPLPEPGPRARERQAYIDNLRGFAIVLVVLMHLKVTYGDMGLWYYVEPGPVKPLAGLVFGIYGSFVQAFCMGLLFFVAGSFVPGSCDRKGVGGFARERLVRLGIPTLVYMLLVHPVTVLLVAGFTDRLPPDLLSWYARYLWSLAFLSCSGPLWFALALLAFSLAYAGLRRALAVDASAPVVREPGRVTHSGVLGLIAIISALAFLLRLVQPMGVPLLDRQVGNFMQLGFFASYAVLFVAGVASHRRRWLEALPYRFGRRWLWLAVGLGVPSWLALMIAGSRTGDPSAFFGGLHWQALGYAVWESFFCVGICLGLLVTFRERRNTQGKLRRFLSENAFGVYVFHAPVLVAVTLAFRGLRIDPLPKACLMACLVLPASYGVSRAIRTVPLLRRVFT